MRRRWHAWRRRQPSRVVYVPVPYGTRIVASRLVATVRVVDDSLPGHAVGRPAVVVPSEP